MSIEKALADLTAALIANTEAVQALQKAQGGKAAAGKAADKEEAETKTTTKTTSKPAAKKGDDEDEISEEVMKAALNKVKEDLGSDEAKKIIKTVAKVEKMADIPEGKRAAVVKKCKEVLEAAAGEGEGGEDDGL
jgi:hypothetical protein